MKGSEDFFGYQHKMVEHQLTHRGSALWADMGLGKTVVSATTILNMKNKFNTRQALVIAPFRVARSTWPNELKEWRHLSDLSICVAVGPENREKALTTRADITTINIENLPWLIRHYREVGKRFHAQWPWDTVILDESQMVRSFKVRYKALMRIRSAVDTFHELTGTPTPRGLMGLWTQMALLDGGRRLGTTLGSYRDRFFSPPQHQYDDWSIKKGAKAEIENLVRDIVFSLSADDYLDLPPVVYNEIYVPIGPKARQAYREMRKTQVLQTDQATIIAVNKGVMTNKLLQICNGAVYSSKGVWHEVHNDLVDEFGERCETLRDAGQPVMALFGYKHDEERLVAELKRRKIKYRVLDTQQDEDDWNAGKIEVLLLHPASGGHGLNLQHGGETIIWFGLTSNLEHFQQANARLMGGHRRIGKNVVIHIIMAEDTIHRKALAVLRDREMDQSSLMAALRRLIVEEEQGDK